MKQGTLTGFLGPKSAAPMEAYTAAAAAATVAVAAASPVAAAQSGEPSAPASASASASASSSAPTPPAAAAGRPSRACKQSEADKAKVGAAAEAKSKAKPKANSKLQQQQQQQQATGTADAYSHADAAGHHDHDDESESAGDTFHCGVCEGRGLMLLCDGPCGRAFHASCMSECPDVSDSWYCVECRDKEHECFICKQTGVDDVEVFLCPAKKCGKFYHKHCVEEHKLRGKAVDAPLGFLCPRHRCASCGDSASRAKHVMCLRCTNSYHTYRCMPQTSLYEFMSGDYILCNTDSETLNATTDRSDEDTVPEEELGLPDLPPPTIEPFNPFALPTHDSTAATAAAASSSSSSPPSLASVSLHFPSALWTPPIAIKDFTLSRGLIEEGEAFVPKPKPVAKTPPYFKRVSANQYGAFVSKPNYKVDSEPCMCAEQKHSCEDDSVCINRAVYTECTRKCPNGDKCKNQRIARREYAPTAVVLTESRGWGLIAKEDIAEGSLIIEYCGEMINDEECTRRLNETEVTGKKDYYFFKLGNDLVIDAGPIGNNARFLNHSCSPNCKTEMWQIGCQQRVGIFALKNVAKGTELTYDYNFEGFWQPGAALKCQCGSANCAGTLGGKKKSKEEMEAAERAKTGKGGAKSKKKPPPPKKRKKETSETTAAAAAASSSSSAQTSGGNTAVAPKRRPPPTDRSQSASRPRPMSDVDQTDSEAEMEDERKEACV